MIAYVNQMDFQGLELVAALRLLFEEGVLDADNSIDKWEVKQKHLLMQQVGERYCKCNPK